MQTKGSIHITVLEIQELNKTIEMVEEIKKNHPNLFHEIEVVVEDLRMWGLRARKD